jgi:hypothetical protein
MAQAPPESPKAASDTYTALAKTAERFLVVLASRLPAGGLDASLHTFGPVYFVSQCPQLQGEFDISGLVAHVERMLPALDEVKLEMRDVVVDDEGARRAVVARVVYGMCVRGSGGECVEHEVGWWMEMDAEGRVVKSREVVDGAAAGRIGELIRAAAGTS